MNETQFCINWDSYLNHVSKGFSSLQQNAEFVDMTLAAEGRLVQVHKNIVALASPYLKAMLQSAPCQHPVIFLNNISHEILGNILEYIYTGEVKIPTNAVDKFIEACKSLHINGINNIDPKNIPAKPQDSYMQRIETVPDNLAAVTMNTDINKIDYDLELLPTNSNNIDNHEEIPIVPAMPVKEEIMDQDRDVIQVAEGNNETQNEIDINSINDFIILKPKNDSDEQNVNVNVRENKIKVIRDVTIKTKDDLTTALTSWNINVCSTQEKASNPAQHLVDIPLNNCQTQNLVNLSSNQPTENPVDISLNNQQTVNLVNSSSYNPAENLVNLSLDTDLTENPVGMSLYNDQTMNLDNLSSNHPNENLVNLSLNTDLSENPVEISLNTNPVEGPVKITLDREWFAQANQNTTSTEYSTNISTLNTNNCLTMPIQAGSSEELNMHPINITVSAKDWQYEPTQDVSHIALPTNPTPVDEPSKSYSNLTTDKKIVYKNLKKIASFTRLSRAQDKMAAIRQKNMERTPHFTVSNRGALQLILNNFMYGVHHHSDAGRKQRWRCTDYRKMHCPAYVDTEDDDLIVVSADHVHPNHDNRIRLKIKSNLVFTSLSQAIDFVERACKDNSDKEKTKNKRRPPIPL